LRGDDEPQRAARNLRSLLRQTPGFLKAAAAVIRKPERVWLRVMDQTVSGSPALFAGIAQFLAKTSPQSGDHRLVAAAEKGLEAYRRSVRAKPLAPPGSFAIGATALQRRIRDELGLDYTLGQVETLALGEVRRVSKLLAEASRRFGQHRRPGDILTELRSQWRPSKPLLDLYREESNRVARGFRSARAVTFPRGDELQIKAVPDFLRALIPTAAYTSPGAFSKRQRGIFWVNDLSLTKSSPADKLAEQQQHFGIPLTCAHEGYPGHHLQFATANRHPRKWRRLF